MKWSCGASKISAGLSFGPFKGAIFTVFETIAYFSDLEIWFDEIKLGWLYFTFYYYWCFFSMIFGLLKSLSSFLSWLNSDGLIYYFCVENPKRELVGLIGYLRDSGCYLLIFELFEFPLFIKLNLGT